MWMLRTIVPKLDFTRSHYLMILHQNWSKNPVMMKDEISSSLKASDTFGLNFSECATFGLKVQVIYVS